MSLSAVLCLKLECYPNLASQQPRRVKKNLTHSLVLLFWSRKARLRGLVRYDPVLHIQNAEQRTGSAGTGWESRLLYLHRNQLYHLTLHNICSTSSVYSPKDLLETFQPLIGPYFRMIFIYRALFIDNATKCFTRQQITHKIKTLKRVKRRTNVRIKSHLWFGGVLIPFIFIWVVYLGLIQTILSRKCKSVRIQSTVCTRE